MRFLNWAVRGWAAGLVLGAAALAPAAAQTGTMYRCPGNDYNNTLTAKEAKDKGCKTIDGAPITIIQITKQRPAATTAPGGASGPAATRIDPAEQRARDSDARRILEAELKREEERLAFMRTEYNNGQPERRGDEKNNQKYLDRVADMKSALARKENDIASIKRELAKLPS